ncbi:MAG: hypothetical protein Kow0020_11250 [Wenzhouxiangellaceae bacterium]
MASNWRIVFWDLDLVAVDDEKRIAFINDGGWRPVNWADTIMLGRRGEEESTKIFAKLGGPPKVPDQS